MSNILTFRKVSALVGVVASLILVAAISPQVSAGTQTSNAASVNYEIGECGETVFNTSAPGSRISNMYLVVYTNGNTKSEKIPTDGTSANITVGPFTTDETVQWRVFGGAERDLDQPLWTGYGTPGFNSSVNTYANQVGDWSWVIAGPGDPNPFTTWNAFDVEGCPLPAEEPVTPNPNVIKSVAPEISTTETEEPAAATPVGGVDAGGGGTSAASTGSVIGLLVSAAAFGLGAVRNFRLSE